MVMAVDKMYLLYRDSYPRTEATIGTLSKCHLSYWFHFVGNSQHRIYERCEKRILILQLQITKFKK